MPYDLLVADTAADDLEALIDSLPVARRDRALDAVQALCDQFAQRPLVRSTSSLPSFPLTFQVDGITHYWVAIYFFTQDERSVVLRHVFRTAF